jgi:hypothetical protein
VNSSSANWLSAAEPELAEFCAAHGARAVRLTADVDIARTEEVIPERLMPFLLVREASGTDIYAMDLSAGEPSIVVWADDAIVSRWDSVDEFRKWIRSQLQTNSQ